MLFTRSLGLTSRNFRNDFNNLSSKTSGSLVFCVQCTVMGRFVRRRFVIRRTCLSHREGYPRHPHCSRISWSLSMFLTAVFWSQHLQGTSNVPMGVYFMVFTAVFILISLFYCSGLRYDRLVVALVFGHFWQGWGGMGCIGV